MAEGRMLKKKISLNEAIADLDNDTHRLLFTWALAHLDIEGRMSGSPRVFKATVAPLLEHITSKKIVEFFKDAQARGLLVYYQVDGEYWIQYPKFRDNQNLRQTHEAPSRIPPPAEDSGSTTVVLQEDAGSTTAEVKLSEVKRSEVKRREVGAPLRSAPAYFTCPFFEIDESYHKVLARDYPGLSPERLLAEIKKAADYVSDNATRYKRRSNGRLVSPKVFLRNWLNRVELPAGEPGALCSHGIAPSECFICKDHIRRPTA